MADIQQIYFTTLTAVGEAKDAKAKALGTALKFTAMAVGDGNGVLPVPDRTRTALVREVRRASINTLKQDPKNPGQLIAEQVIPEDEGGWWIRELGLYDADGDLFAIANCPETYKPVLAQGSGRTQVVRMVLVMTSAASVQLKVDPSVVLATRQYVDDQDAAHVNALDPHPQYTTAEELAKAVTPKAPLESPAFTGNPNAPTPPQFDRDTSLATTEFVQRALGNYRALLGVSANIALTVENIGQVVSAAFNGGTVTLPTSAGIPGGSTITIQCNAASMTVVAGGSNQMILGDGIGRTSFQMVQGDTVTLVCPGGNAPYVWYAVGGSAPLRYGAAFGCSLNLNGYQRLPSKLIIQWGQATTNAAGIAVLTLPIAFPNGFLSGTVTYSTNVLQGGRSLNMSGTATTATGYMSDAAGNPVSGAVVNFFVIGV